jgi:phenylalanyl-tRNA synthetase alpha subunit
MEITAIDNRQAHIQSRDQEIMTIKKIFSEVKKDLDHEPEFHTRTGIYYSEADEYLSLINNDYNATLEEIIFLNNILNEAQNVIRFEDFNIKIGCSKDEITS